MSFKKYSRGSASMSRKPPGGMCVRYILGNIMLSLKSIYCLLSFKIMK